MKCRLCEYKLELKKVNQEGTLPSGDKFYFEDKIYHCNNCGFEQSHQFENKNYITSKKNAIQTAIKSIVGNLQKKFQNLLYIERTLDLPRRTLSRWKHSGEGSASSLLLLKMLDTFPFLIEVAENKFDPNFAEKALIEAAKYSVRSNYKVEIYPSGTRIADRIFLSQAVEEDVIVPVDIVTYGVRNV